MKIALITDTHFGARGDSQFFARHFKQFYEEVFFPIIDERGIDTIVHLGDIVDRRKYINYLTMKNLKDVFIKPCLERKIDLRVIVGNHDTFYKNTNKENALRILFEELEYPSYYEGPEEIELGGLPILIMPWICADNYDEAMETIENTSAQVMLGHLEIEGFEMYKGQFMKHGLSPTLFKKFDMVLSGHYHHKSTERNITYLGAPYEITWADCNDPRGFHILDTETLELEYIENPIRMFYKLEYDETKPIEEDLSFLSDKMVKVIVNDRESVEKFDLFMTNLEEIAPEHLQTVENNTGISILEDEEDIINAAEDTPTMLMKYIAAMELKNPEPLENLFQELYTEALALDKKGTA